MKTIVNWVAIIVVACIFGGGAAYAANTVGSADIIDNSVQGVDIRDRTIRAPDLVGAPWKSVGPAASGVNCATTTARFCFDSPGEYWENWGGAYQTVRFRRDATNEVTLQGRLHLFNTGAFTLPTIFYLPVNYRPGATLVFPIHCWNNSGFDTAGSVHISSDGAVQWFHNDACDVTVQAMDLTGISFPIN